ncbi:MAG: hypothetical protein KC635_11910 [Myxococcales bacterium]|nr:hypothetical protein [Myxococcales bacterium]MCB9737308.1 hypothetical protein [Deltaproteobacteria bacterium]
MSTPTIIARVMPSPTEAPAISLPVGGTLHTWYWIATPFGAEPLTLAHMVKHGLSLAAVQRAAVDHLWARLEDHVSVFREDEREPYRLHALPGFAASTLLLRNLWDELASEVCGALVLRVSNQNQVLFAGTDEREAMAKLAGGRRRRPLLLWTKDGWAPYRVTPTLVASLHAA